ncbi:Tubulin glycylase 3A [Aphis craccivora]|uniref:Tubulin glycylase 3A n=1 Tax=Aphis craccivora TaxID=307492 RepID=A0A6G0YT73_APHCR|nr:Tubulin glycylase 3A [Aphis craccivora]
MIKEKTKLNQKTPVLISLQLTKSVIQFHEIYPLDELQSILTIHAELHEGAIIYVYTITTSPHSVSVLIMTHDMFIASIVILTLYNNVECVKVVVNCHESSLVWTDSHSESINC